MRRDKVFNRSLLILAIMSIMLFAMTITASAASGRAVTNLQQTDDTKTGVTVQWSGNYGEEYLVYLSQDRSSGYQALSSYTSTSNKKYIYNLQAGRAYYVIVQTYVNKQLVGQSDPLQVITTPESVDYKSIKQTSGTKNKIGLQWNRVSGVTGYVVAKISGSKVEAQYNVTTNKATVPAKAGTLIWSPAKSGNVITIGWKANPNYDYPTGYQVQIYSLNGKTRLYTTKATTKTRVKINNAKVRKAINNKGFKVRIRAYKEANGGAKCWSDWSAFKTIIPQACVKKSNVTSVSSTAAKVKWKKVANTKYYLVYYTKNPYASNAKWIKKKVSAKSSSYTIRGLKAYSTFGVYVIPVVKVRGKTYRGQACEYIRCSYYYR